MRIDRVRRLLGYSLPAHPASCYNLCDRVKCISMGIRNFCSSLQLYLSNLGLKKQPLSPTSSLLSSSHPQNPLHPIHSFGLVPRLRGGNGSDSSSSDSDSDLDPDSDAPKRKQRAKHWGQGPTHLGPKKGKAKATEPDSDSGGIRVTVKPEKRKGGMFVDKVFYVDAASAPESLDNCSEMVTFNDCGKKECQDAWDAPTGTPNNKLTKVVLLDPDSIHWSSTDEQHLQVFVDTRTAKASESSSVAATASAFFRSVKAALCNGTYLDSDGSQKGKTYFVGCSNRSADDSDRMSKIHRFTAIALNVRESVVIKIFKGEQIDEEDDDTDVLVGTCSQIIHPSHIPSKSICPRTHSRDRVHMTAKLKKHACGAKLSILTPIDPNELRAVVIPAVGISHTHPAFPRAKVPALVQQKYDKCIEAAGSIGMTTRRIDKGQFINLLYNLG
ncbi:hypothetical protein K438DRAFT_1764948 [Mycena galopus ATCC 62051]|nr:hypothetical protein K438DRAFT_1764948 [Mycena galopus ATCC 62051]